MKKSRKHAALVFNCQYNGLAIIQELGRHDVECLALDHVRSVGTFSRYARFHRCPDPQVAEEAFIAYLLDLGKTFHDKPVLFPTNDHWAVAISRHKERLSPYYLPCIADRSTVELVIEKQRFYDWALSQGYPVPRSWKSVDIRTIPDDAIPIVAKPEHRRISSNDQETGRLAHILDTMRLTLLKDQSALSDFSDRFQELLPAFIFQEYVEGLSDCMYTVGIYANQQGEVLGLFTGRKVRGFPPDVGDCIVGQIEKVPDEIINLVKQISRDIRYHGIAEFEFKRDLVTGVFKLIEINPRSWSWVGITPACGVSLPWIAYLDMMGMYDGGHVESDLPDGSVKWVKLIDDFLNCLHRNRQAGYPQWHMTFQQWRASLRADRLVTAEFAVDDPVPGLYSLYVLGKSILRRLFREK